VHCNGRLAKLVFLNGLLKAIAGDIHGLSKNIISLDENLAGSIYIVFYNIIVRIQSRFQSQNSFHDYL